MILRGSHNQTNGSIPPAFDPATITLNAIGVNVSGNLVYATGYDKVVELGETIDVTLTGSITPNDESEITNRMIEINIGSDPGISFESNTFSLPDAGVSDERSYQAKADVNNNGNPATINSIIRKLKFDLPVLFGSIPDINETPENLYAALGVKMTKQDQVFSVLFNSAETQHHKVIAIPYAWADITSIIKDGQWEQINSFTKTIKWITKTGGVWTTEYKFYATNLMNPMSETEYQITF